MAVPDQCQLDVQPCWFGLEGHGADQAQGLAWRLDPDFTGGQGSLERLPGQGLVQQAHRIQDQVAARRSMQDARLDQAEVREERAHLRAMLHAPDQVGQGRVVFVADRRALTLTIVDQHVDAIAVEAGPADSPSPTDGLLVALAGGNDGRCLLDDAALNGLEVSAQLCSARVAFAQIIDEMRQGLIGHLAIELAQLLAHLALPAWPLTEDSLQQGLHGLDLGGDALLLGVRQLREGFGVQDLAIAHRSEDQPHGGVDHRKSPRLGLVLQLTQGLGMPLLEDRLEGLTALVIVFGLEDPRKQVGQLLDQVCHVGLEAPAHARWQLDQPRLVRCFEIVHVAQIGRWPAPGCRLFEGTAYQAMPAATLCTQHVDVVALANHAHRQGEGLLDPSLAEVVVPIWQCRGVLEIQGLRIDKSPQGVGRQGLHCRRPAATISARFCVSLRFLHRCVSSGPCSPCLRSGHDHRTERRDHQQAIKPPAGDRDK